MSDELYTKKVNKKSGAVYLNPVKEHTHTLIFMHGLGDTGEGFEGFFQFGFENTLENFRIVLPTAP